MHAGWAQRRAKVLATEIPSIKCELVRKIYEQVQVIHSWVGMLITVHTKHTCFMAISSTTVQLTSIKLFRFTVAVR